MSQISTLAGVVLARTYARPIGNRIENWPEIAERVIQGNVSGHNVSEKEIERLRYFMLERKASPAGRGLWISGTSVQKNLGGAGLVNCWHITSDDWNNFVLAQDLFMLGGGVGVSVESKYVDKLPAVKKDVLITHKLTKDADLIVPDSREGWCRLLYRFLESWFVTGKGFTYSTICIRSAGEPIKGFGGISSGPRPLVRMIEKLKSVFYARQGKKLRPIDTVDVICCIAEMVVSGNVRRGAIIIQGDPWDREYLKAKRWDLGPIPTQRSNANFSVVASDAEHDLRPLFWKTYEQGEPFGIINMSNIRKFARMGEEKFDNAVGVNPCFSEDTLIAVADGRGQMSIKGLAEEGNDIPVYSFNPKTNMVEIKMARNPRVTGYNQKLLKITLDDGSVLKVTPNHKFYLRNGTQSEAKDLKSGDSLFRFTKRQEKVVKGGSKYWRVYCNLDNRYKDKVFEHRLVYQFYKPLEWKEKYNDLKNNGWIKGGLVVHHKDYNSLNNSVNNLSLMSFEEHATLHANMDTQGGNNGRYSGYSNKDLEQIAVNLTKELGRKFSYNEWNSLKRDIPTKFTKWRAEHWFKSPAKLSVWAAIECGFEEFANLDPRSVKIYQKAIYLGYNTKIIDKMVFVEKRCETCQKAKLVPWINRESSFCNTACFNKSRNNKDIERATKTLQETVVEKQKITRHSQIMIYKDLEVSLSRFPFKKEWETECKNQKVPVRFKSKDSYKNNPYALCGFNDLKKVSVGYNHRVISIEEVEGSNHTVYNLTVDDNHTVAVVTGISEKGDINGVFTAQCGEATLANNEPCNLQDINLTVINNKEEFAEAARLMHRWGKRVTLEKYHWPQIQEIIEKNRRIGTGITGCLQRPDLFNPETLDFVYKQIQDENVNYSQELGINRSIRTTVIKPSGSLSKAFDSPCEGIHPAYSRHFIQRIRIASNDSLVAKLKEAGHHIEPQQRLDGSLDPDTLVVDFYVKTPENVPCADEGFDTWKQLDAVKMAQKYWADQSISVTAYYKEEELSKVQDWVTNNLSEIKTVSFLRHSGHGFVQAPKEPITSEQYERLTSKLKTIKIDDVSEAEMLEGAECEGGACPVR